MANASIAWENKADPNGQTNILAGVAPIVSSVSSQALTMPASNIFSGHVMRRWRTLASSAEFFVVDLTVLRTIDVVGVFGMTMTSAGTIRVRLLDNGAATLVDSGVQTVDNKYNSFIYLPGSVVNNVRFIRCDFSDPTASYIEAGRLYAGRLNNPSTNFAYGWTRGFVDRSIHSITRGGQTQIWLDNHYRTMELTFNFLTATERNDFVELADIYNGQSFDILLITDTASSNLPRDSIWGLASELTAVQQPYFDRYSKRYKIEERL